MRYRGGWLGSKTGLQLGYGANQFSNDQPGEEDASFGVEMRSIESVRPINNLDRAELFALLRAQLFAQGYAALVQVNDWNFSFGGDFLHFLSVGFERGFYPSAIGF